MADENMVAEVPVECLRIGLEYMAYQGEVYQNIHTAIENGYKREVAFLQAKLNLVMPYLYEYLPARVYDEAMDKYNAISMHNIVLPDEPGYVD